jgi:hypothetical protein
MLRARREQKAQEARRHGKKDLLIGLAALTLGVVGLAKCNSYAKTYCDAREALYGKNVAISGKVVDGTFTPSELGSGDHYSLIVETCRTENTYQTCAPGQIPEQKEFRYAWPDARKVNDWHKPYKDMPVTIYLENCTDPTAGSFGTNLGKTKF